jgi:GNAT superfamily N-acetyltransferase
MVIREFVAADQAAARLLILGGLGDHFGFIDTSLNRDLQDIEQTYIRNGHVFLVAEIDAKVVGTGGLVLESPLQGRIVRMSVASTYRRRGIARSLVHRIVECAHARALCELVVATQPEWADAVGLYRAVGFVPFDRNEVDVQMRLQLRLT